MSQLRKDQYIQVYDKESEVYDSSRDFYESGYGGKRERQLLARFCSGPAILNAACGTGRLLNFLAQRSKILVGLDLSRQMLNVAKRKVGHAENVHFVRADAETLPFRSGSFEEIVISRAFKFFPDPSKALSEGYTALKTYGKYIISVETSDPVWIRVAFVFNLPYPGAKFEWRYRQKDVRKLFEKNGFVVHRVRCLVYFGRSVYEKSERRFPFLMRFLKLVDSTSRTGRNILIVGLKHYE